MYMIFIFIQDVTQYPDTSVKHRNNFPLLVARALKFGPEKVYLVLNMKKDSGLLAQLTNLQTIFFFILYFKKKAWGRDLNAKVKGHSSI